MSRYEFSNYFHQLQMIFHMTNANRPIITVGTSFTYNETFITIEWMAVSRPNGGPNTTKQKKRKVERKKNEKQVDKSRDGAGVRATVRRQPIRLLLFHRFIRFFFHCTALHRPHPLAFAAAHSFVSLDFEDWIDILLEKMKPIKCKLN